VFGLLKAHVDKTIFQLPNVDQQLQQLQQQQQQQQSIQLNTQVVYCRITNETYVISL
jgi:hypothetical protein